MSTEMPPVELRGMCHTGLHYIGTRDTCETCDEWEADGRESVFGKTPLPGQKWCPYGHLNGGRATECRTCDHIFDTDEGDE